MQTPLSMIALFVVGNAFAGALDNWHWRNPLPTSSLLIDVTFGGGLFVAVGHGGDFVTSSDGENWTARSSESRVFLRGVAYGNGMFLAHGIDEGNNGVVLTSPDGLTWTRSIAQTAANLLDVTFAQGMFVGVGLSVFRNGALTPLIATSPDGRNWTTQTSVPQDNTLTGIAYGNGTFVAVGGGELIASSTDGLNWTETSSGNVHGLRGVAFGDGRFVAVGSWGVATSLGTHVTLSYVLTSPDGLNWSTAWSLDTATAPKPLLDLSLGSVSYGNGLFVACGGGQAVLTSPDGLNWTEHDLGAKRTLLGIAYGNQHHAAVGAWSTVDGVTSGPIVSSPDGRTWTDRTSGVPTDGNLGLAFGNGTYVAAGRNGQILTSMNGVKWTQPTELSASAGLFGAGYGNGVFLVLGAEVGPDRLTQGLLLVSTNGMQWTNRAPPGANRLWSAAYGSSQFVVVGITNALVSTNGWDWSASTSATATNLEAVTFGEGLFVGVGLRGTIQTSIDGLDWLTRGSGTNATLNAVAFGKGKYVAVGNEVIVTSADAVDWSVSQTGDWALKGVAFGGGTFVAVGLKTRSNLGGAVILTSEDGVVWTERPFSKELRSVVYDGGTFLIGGEDGTILQSDPLVTDLAPSLGIRRASGVELILSGTAGATYQIEYSDDLGPGISWGPLTTMETTNGTVIFTDPLVPATIQRFYRAALLP